MLTDSFGANHNQKPLQAYFWVDPAQEEFRRKYGFNLGDFLFGAGQQTFPTGDWQKSRMGDASTLPLGVMNASS